MVKLVKPATRKEPTALVPGFRCSERLARAFGEACEAAGVSASEALRQLVVQFCKSEKIEVD